MSRGYVLVTSACAVCGEVISYNPNRVPSVRVRGEREPVCRPCIEAANPVRVSRGLDPITIHPNAYEAEPEENVRFGDD